MYSLKEGWLRIAKEPPIDHWDGKVLCTRSNAEMAFLTNETQGFMACYSFLLVTRGWITITYNGRELTFGTRDLYIYSPGMAVTVIATARDYEALCLMVDENTTLETPGVRDLVGLAYKPIVQLSEPKVTLSAEAAAQLEGRMREIIRYFYSGNVYKEQVLRMLYAVFLLDLQNAQDHAMPQRGTPRRVEEIFINFIRLLPRHFARHHDIGFYAGELHITPDYLSRVVKRVTGRTVVDYINQLLVMETAFLLRTTTLSVTQIADRLHFADKSSLSKFFTRHKGVSPRVYRSQCR